MDYMKIYQQWCSDPYFDDATKAELKAIENNKEEIEDRFYRQLEFGTGGLRGVIGAGTNRMNIYTVRQATQGARTDRKRVWQSHMTREECLRNLQQKQHFA